MKEKIILFLFLYTLAGVSNAFGAHLIGIDRVQLATRVKFYFYFDKAPSYSSTLLGTRLDLQFTATEGGDSLSLPATNSDIIRFITQQNGDNFSFSCFFRYVPESFSMNRINEKEICLDIEFGNIYSNSVKTLSRRLGSITKTADNELRFLSPLATSIYKDNWASFFKLYEPKINITYPIELTWPPFPLTNYLEPAYSSYSTLLSPELLTLGFEGKWNELNLALPTLIENTLSTEDKTILTFLYAEALARSGKYKESYNQLVLLIDQFPNTHLAHLATYLKALVHARYVDPYLPSIELKKIENSFSPKNPIRYFIYFNRIEIGLATEELETVNELLQGKEIGIPHYLLPSLSLRQADYWYALEQPIKAAAAYRVAEQEGNNHLAPYSQNGYCSSLFMQKKYAQAANCYQELKKQTESSELLSLMEFMHAWSKAMLAPENDSTNRSRFRTIHSTFSGYEGGDRARMKELDISFDMPKERDRRKSIAQDYLLLARESLQRDISEEAYLKAALAYYLIGDKTSALDTLSEQAHKIKTGGLVQTGQALLLEILPKEVDKLFKEQRYKELIILVQKNNILLANGWLPTNTTKQLALSYYALGLDEDAFSTFSYLVSSSNALSENTDSFYLPLITAGYNQNKFNQVIDYATDYLRLYPDGENAEEILLLKAKALFALGQTDKSLTFIPETMDGERFLTCLFYHEGRYRDVVTRYEKIAPKSDEERFFYAESLFQLGQTEKAYEIFSQLPKTHYFTQQSLYRQASFLRSQKELTKAQSLLEETVVLGAETSWGKLASKDIEYIKLVGIE